MVYAIDYTAFLYVERNDPISIDYCRDFMQGAVALSERT